MTKLETPLKREIQIGGEAYKVVIDPEGLRLVRKGRRKGLELAWRDLVSGQTALAVALNASLESMPAETVSSRAARRSPAHGRAR